MRKEKEEMSARAHFCVNTTKSRDDEVTARLAALNKRESSRRYWRDPPPEYYTFHCCAQLRFSGSCSSHIFNCTDTSSKFLPRYLDLAESCTFRLPGSQCPSLCDLIANKLTIQSNGVLCSTVNFLMSVWNIFTSILTTRS